MISMRHPLTSNRSVLTRILPQSHYIGFSHNRLLSYITLCVSGKNNLNLIGNEYLHDH